MIQSMTGYGKAICELPDKAFTIEIKSLNSKQTDIYARLPNHFKEKELEIRNQVAQKLVRGKIEINISTEEGENGTSTKLNIPVIQSYLKQVEEVTTANNTAINDIIIQTVMRFPDVMKTEKEELNPEEWLAIEKGLQEATDKLISFRNQEGKALYKDIVKRVQAILDLVEETKPFEKERIETIRQRIEKSLNENIEVEKIDQNRFEQELVYYLEKLDITEEIVRLQNHCKFFNEVIEQEPNCGKKLGFISQEMGREINTLGSKANHSSIQRCVVLMKDELEKIKEQLMNVL